MAKQVNVGYTDTAIGGVTSLSFARGLVNFGADFRKKTVSPSEVIITNLTSPVDRPEKFRFSYAEVSDVYSGSSIDPSVFAPSKKGVSVLAQVNETFSVTDSVDASYRVDLPVSCHIVIKVPSNDNLTSEMIQTMVGRLVSGLFDTGSTSVSRISSLMRGSLSPGDVK